MKKNKNSVLVSALLVVIVITLGAFFWKNGALRSSVLDGGMQLSRMSDDELNAELSYVGGLYAPLAQTEAAAQKSYQEAQIVVKNAEANVQQYEPLCTQKQNNLTTQQALLTQFEADLKPLQEAHAVLEKVVTDLQDEVTNNTETIKQNTITISANTDEINKLNGDKKKLNPKSQEYKNIVTKIDGPNGLKADSKKRTDDNTKLKKRNTDISAKNGLLSKAQKQVADNLKTTTPYMKKKTAVNNQANIVSQSKNMPECSQLVVAKTWLEEAKTVLASAQAIFDTAHADTQANLLISETIQAELSARYDAQMKKDFKVYTITEDDATTQNTSTTENNTTNTNNTENTEGETMWNTNCPNGKVQIWSINGRPICSCPHGCSENAQGQCGRWVKKGFWSAFKDSIIGNGQTNIYDTNPETGDSDDLVIGTENDFGETWESC